MSTIDNPTSLGFISRYVINSNGEFTESVGAIGSFNEVGFDYYTFSYPIGLKEVTIDIYTAPVSYGDAYEYKSVTVGSLSNLRGGPQNLASTNDAARDQTLSKQYSVNYQVSPGNPGKAGFSIFAFDQTSKGYQPINYTVRVTNKYEEPPVCFTSGTIISTSRGEVIVENLRISDLVVTVSGALRSIVWIGHRQIDDLTCEQAPVRIRAGAFGGGLPKRDLFLSPGHPVLVGADADNEGGALVPVMCLINGTTITREPVASVTYWHIELDAHDILLAEGLPAESYIDGGDRTFFSEASDHALHNPDFVVPGWDGRCRPVAVDGPLVEAERLRLDAIFAGSLNAQCDWNADDVWAAA